MESSLLQIGHLRSGSGSQPSDHLGLGAVLLTALRARLDEGARLGLIAQRAISEGSDQIGRMVMHSNLWTVSLVDLVPQLLGE